MFAFSGSVEKEPEVTDGQFLICRAKDFPQCFFFLFFFFSLINHLSASGTTSPDWIGFQEAEYKFFDHRTTWDQAQRICTWMESSLASVHSAEEEAFLADTLRKVEAAPQ